MKQKIDARDPMLRHPGEPLDGRDDPDPGWTVDGDLSEQAAHGLEHDPLA